MEKKVKVEITDRYKATGTPYPTADSCDPCDGMGIYPQSKDSLNAEACNSPKGRILIVGQKEKDGSPMPEDGWVFVQCPHCNGTRKKPNPPNQNE